MNAVVAIVLGGFAAVVLLIPVAAIQYRRDGRLGPGDLLTLLAAAIYGLALWTYTLLPVPVEGDYTCVGKQTELFDSFRPIFDHGITSLSGLLRDAAFQQIAFNVVFFVPFGFFVRLILRRGFITATVLGFAMSLLIETTQGTGVWGLYPCPYRLFDVDDLMVNTAGALLGGLLAAIFIDRTPKRVRLPQHVTLGRRLMGMLCDGVFVMVTGLALSICYVAWQQYGPNSPQPVDTRVQTLVQWGFPLLLEALAVLGLGKTIGEWTVDLRTRARTGVSTGLGVIWARIVKLLLGVAPLLVLGAIGTDLAGNLAFAWAVLAVIAAWVTPGHRGLSNTVAGLELEIDHEEHRG